VHFPKQTFTEVLRSDRKTVVDVVAIPIIVIVAVVCMPSGV